MFVLTIILLLLYNIVIINKVRIKKEGLMILQNRKLRKQNIEGLGILPSVWGGYDKPRSEIIGETLEYEGIVETSPDPRINQEKVKDLVNIFQNGSVGDFCGRYLSRFMDSEEHKKILQVAQDILTKNLKVALEQPNSTLVKLAGMDVAHNAMEYGHRMFKTACFLEEVGQLPRELRFVLGMKINPAFYTEQEKFDLCEKMLETPMKKISPNLTQGAFDRWIVRTGEYGYIDCLQTCSKIEFLLAKHQPKMLKDGIEDLIASERIGRRKPDPSRTRISFRRERS